MYEFVKDAIAACKDSSVLKGVLGFIKVSKSLHENEKEELINVALDKLKRL
jgi:hypothetical protein